VRLIGRDVGFAAPVAFSGEQVPGALGLGQLATAAELPEVQVRLGDPAPLADTSTLTPARVRALADPIIRTWVENSGQQLVTRIQQEPPGGLAATGLAACLNVVRQHAVQILAVPDHGLVPGFACRRCGALGRTRTGCAHGASAASAVPDLIEEMAVGTIHDGGQVQAVPDPPGGIAAWLRFPTSHRDNT